MNNEEAQTPEGQTPEGQTPEGQTPEGQTPEAQTPEGQTPEAQTPEGQTPEGQTQTFNTAKESSGGQFDATKLNNDVIQLETELKLSAQNTVNEEDFYKNINEYLTEDELDLYHEDNKTLYFDAVNKAKTKYVQEKSIDTTEVEKKLATAKDQLHVANAIEDVLSDANYKDYNHSVLSNFFENDLTKKEQQEITKNVTKEKLADGLKLVYDLYRKKNPLNVKTVTVDNIPDTTNIQKKTLDDKIQIDEQKEKQNHRKKIGFNKL